MMRVLLLAVLLPGLAWAGDATRIVGGPGGGCIAGAVQLPEAGPGYQTIRASRSFFWGAPGTIAALQLLAREARAAGLAELYMNDISKPRGGPFPGVHASHMLGLDADVWLDLRPKPPLTPAQRDGVEVDSLVRADGRGVDTTRWLPQHEALIKLATGLPGVDRVLVNPAIKRQLCLAATGDRSWLHLVRPWYGHAAHMHIHFRCPAEPAGMHRRCAAAAGRRLRRQPAMVVRPARRPAQARIAAAPRRAAARLRRDHGNAAGLTRPRHVRRHTSPCYEHLIPTRHPVTNHVIPGLDPGICRTPERHLPASRYGRVKPGHDVQP